MTHHVCSENDNVLFGQMKCNSLRSRKYNILRAHELLKVISYTICVGSLNPNGTSANKYDLHLTSLCYLKLLWELTLFKQSRMSGLCLKKMEIFWNLHSCIGFLYYLPVDVQQLDCRVHINGKKRMKLNETTILEFTVHIQIQA